MDKYIIGKCDNCGIEMIVGTPIENKVVCHNCYQKYEKDKIKFLQDLSDKQKQQIKETRKQVCDEIRNRSSKSYGGHACNLGKDFYVYSVCDFVLDEIEQGKCTTDNQTSYTNFIKNMVQ